MVIVSLSIVIMDNQQRRVKILNFRNNLYKIKEEFNMPILLRESIKWKPILTLNKGNKAYNHVYDNLFISNYGDIKKIVNNKEIYCKTTYDSTKKYNVVTLTVYDGNEIKHKTFLVHRLVATIFIPNPNKYNIVNHINCNKLDNYYKNLEWTTTKGNMIHASKNGLCHPIFGENHYISKLCNDDVIHICKLINENISNVEIARILNNSGIDISRQAINQIRIKKSWKHIANKYLD